MRIHLLKLRLRVPSWKWFVLAIYIGLLLISHLVREQMTDDRYLREEKSVAVQAVDRERKINKEIRIAYKEYFSAESNIAPTVILLHGSPGGKTDFSHFAPFLAKSFRVIVPDLPGFGSSTLSLPDYSFRAHAHYILEMLDRLHIERAHLVGFSMGGGVALHLADIAPERVQSIVMLSAIGVQEMELLGDYHLNHALHGLQLAGLWLLREGVPHFGLLDNSIFGVTYARNFFDSDQRPLRAILTQYRGPMLIVHGKQDMLVPVEAALEHHRLVPQSELQLMPDESHFYLFGGGAEQANLTGDFITRVEQGRAAVSDTAGTARLARASDPFDPLTVPRARGITVLILVVLIALATLISEDLTCIGAGVMAAQGRISFTLAAFACLLGIFVGDLLLFLAGRYLGRPALKYAPLKWIIKPEDVEKSSIWFNRQGGIVIMLSRFLPGTRLPTYFDAGLLNTSLWKFSFFFLIAAAIWTPLLVGLAMILGAEALKSSLLAGQGLLVKVLVSGFVIFIVVKFLVRLLSFRGRRSLISRLRRIRHWEFWPPWIFYPPVLCYIVWLGLKHRSLTLFTCANPAIPGGGFIGESKIEILQNLSASATSQSYVARAMLISTSSDTDTRLKNAREFMLGLGLTFPVVLKPNVGQRGSGVTIVRSESEMVEYLQHASGDTIIQEYIPGFEFGVFYYRFPEDTRGHIFSITEKCFPVVTGDGTSTLERLILRDKRAVCMARAYFKQHRDRLSDIPGKDETVRLIEIGTHCRGAVFLDGGWVKTPALEEAIDRLTRGFKEFYFGRFDIKTSSIEDFKHGKNFKVVELNGVTSEATNIYDPKNSLFTAYKVLFEQWRIAFEIGAQNRARGIRPVPFRLLMKLILANIGWSSRPAQNQTTGGNITWASRN